MKISTIIPAYNCAAYLKRAVDSLLATQDPDLEIVIAEDGSKDDTLEVARRLQAERPEAVKVVTHPGGLNRGVSATRNLGIESSVGEWIALLDADDYVLPHRFLSAREILTGQPDIDGVYQLCALEFANEDDRKAWWEDSAVFGFDRPVPSEQLILELLRGKCWATSAIVFRRSLLARTGYFHTNLKVAEDCHLWFRMAVAGKLVAGDLSQPVSVYWRHGESAYQPAPELRIQMILAMTSFWNWLKANAPRTQQRADISRVITEYILSGMQSARNSGRRSLAWQVALESAWRYGPLMRQRRWYGQVARMALGR